MTENNNRSLNLWQKLAAISNKVGHIEKTGKNTHFNYAFMEHSQIVAALRPIMDEYGITIDMEALDATWDEAKSTRVLLHMTYTVTNADKPEETFTRRWVSEAMDQQDKGINKALTAAEKNVFMKLFHISDVDLEADENDQPQQPARKAPTQVRAAQVTQTAPRLVNPTTPAQMAPKTASAPVVTPQPIPAPPPTQLSSQIPAKDPNFIFFKDKIQAANSMKELKELGQLVKTKVEDIRVKGLLRVEYERRENVLLDIANAKIDSFASGVK